MDWAEDIKLSIRKTANRKGRRSKSRDLLKETTPTGQATSSTGAVTTITNSIVTKTNQPELSIDIMFNMEPKESTPTATATATSNNMSSGSGTSDGLILNINATNKTESKLPSFLRRISGGWAEPSFGKTIKSKKGSLEDDRFNAKYPKETLPIQDDICCDPQYNEYQSDNLLQNKHHRSSLSTMACKPEEKILSAIADTDLSILTKRLQTIENVDEADDLWEWQKVFTEVMADINYTNKPFIEQKKLILKPDEVPPPSSLIH